MKFFNIIVVIKLL